EEFGEPPAPLADLALRPSPSSDRLPATAGATTALTTRRPTSSVPWVTSSDLAEATEDAAMADVAQALAMVMAAHGRSMDEGRIKTVALLVADQGWKRAELMQAARILASDPKVRDHLRYGGTISPADFEELRRPQERREHDPVTGDVTIITTRT